METRQHGGSASRIFQGSGSIEVFSQVTLCCKDVSKNIGVECIVAVEMGRLWLSGSRQKVMGIGNCGKQ